MNDIPRSPPSGPSFTTAKVPVWGSRSDGTPNENFLSLPLTGVSFTETTPWPVKKSTKLADTFPGLELTVRVADVPGSKPF